MGNLPAAARERGRCERRSGAGTVDGGGYICKRLVSKKPRLSRRLVLAHAATGSPLRGSGTTIGRPPGGCRPIAGVWGGSGLVVAQPPPHPPGPAEPAGRATPG